MQIKSHQNCIFLGSFAKISKINLFLAKIRYIKFSVAIASFRLKKRHCRVIGKATGIYLSSYTKTLRILCFLGKIYGDIVRPPSAVILQKTPSGDEG